MTGVADERALLLQQYAPLRRYAAVVGPWDVDPDDLVQEAMVRVLGLGQLTIHDDLGAYLRRTVLNIAASHARKAGRGKRAMGRVGPSATTANQSYPSDISELLRLPPRDRAAVFLVDVEGWTFRDLAIELGCSEQAARARVSRARRKLRDHMLADDAEVGRD
ncbi:MAG: putative polymerase subfamily sigma factor [Acidimicrobiales bacterium]|jgi:RNA polymerase sigma-70 factor (ECF subfamily)|nr:putative polymerase subfamily sigma factor [Acidimicrobiales bacterium]